MENNELVVKIERIVALESKLKAIKEIEKQIKEEKENLRQAMIEVNLKAWETPNKTKITLVEDTPETEIEVEVLDVEKWENDNESLVDRKKELEEEIKESQKDYINIETQIKNGRKGYVRITLPKEEKK